MPHKASRSVTLIGDDDDTLSQYSKGLDNDDPELEIYRKAVAEFKVTWQKQKRKKGKKFLRTAQAKLDAHVDRKTGQVKGVMNDMGETYQESLLTYAAIDDKKREVIVKIVDTQKTPVAPSVRKRQESVQFTQNLEESQLEALKEIKQSCQGFTGMVDAFMNI